MFSKKNFVLFAFIVFQVAVSNSVLLGSGDSGDASVTPLITIKAQGDPLQEVIKSIAIQTKYEVAIDQKWGGQLVTGNFSQVSVDEFFKRTLRGENISIIYNDVEKKIVVRLFGQKTPVKLISVAVGEDGEIRQRHLIQDEEFEKSRKDPNYEDMSGMSNAEKWEKYRDQDKEYKNSKNDPDQVDMSGMSNAEKWEKYQRQDEFYRKEKEDPHAKDMSGMSNAEKWEKYKRQDEDFKNSKVDPEYTDMSGMTNAEIWEKHKKQDEEYKKSKKRAL